MVRGAAASMLQAALQQYSRNAAHVRSGCRTIHGRQRPSGGCHSDRSVVGTLDEGRGWHSSMLRISYTRDTPACYMVCDCTLSTNYKRLDTLRTCHITSNPCVRQYDSGLESRDRGVKNTRGHPRDGSCSRVLYDTAYSK